MIHHYLIGNEYLIAAIGLQKATLLFKLNTLIQEQGVVINGERWVPYKLSSLSEKLAIENELQLKVWMKELHKDGYIMIQPITTCTRSKWVRLSRHLQFNHVQYKLIPIDEEAAS